MSRAEAGDGKTHAVAFIQPEVLMSACMNLCAHASDFVSFCYRATQFSTWRTKTC